MFFMRFYPRVGAAENREVPDCLGSNFSFRDGRVLDTLVTPKRRQFRVSSVYCGLNQQFLAQQFHSGQQFLIIAPVAVVGFDV
jgi:hypothetical protein